MTSLFSYLSYTLLFLIFHPQMFSLAVAAANNATSIAPTCHPEERSALLQMKAEFPGGVTTVWSESEDCCVWVGVECGGHPWRVIGLDLSYSSLDGPIGSNSSLFLLRHLRKLDLSGNDFKGSSVPAEFGLLETMTHLDLSYTNFGGALPLEIARLSKLVSFKMYVNNENGVRISSATFVALSRNLTELAELGLAKVDMSSVPLALFVNMSSLLTTLEFSSCNLRGMLPESGFLLPYLESLLLVGNYIDGRIPSSLLSHRKLERLDISLNNLSGSIPEVYSNVSSIISLLTSLSLTRNSLSGPIPSWIYTSSSLEYLDLSENLLTGEISKFRSSVLASVSLRLNKLHGVIPSEIFQHSSDNLAMLDISSNNFTGDVDLKNFAKLIRLSDLDLSFNNLSLRFNNSMRYNVDFHFLGLSSCNIAEFPNFLKSLTNLNTLDLSRNRIRGMVPKWLWEMGKDSLSYLNIAENFLTQMDPLRWSSLQVLDVRSNFLRGPIPILFSPSLSVFQASKNQLSGEISTSFCRMTFLLVLNLSYNNLSGKMPPCFGNMTGYLSVLDLQMNKFHGFIQFSFVKGNAMRTLNLNGNQLNGSLPRNLLNCKELEVVDVGNNKLRGPFPQWLESLPKLQVLILRSNNFHGRLSENTSTLSFENLKIMDLSTNNFTGPLPYFGNFTAMMDAHSDKLAYMEHEYDNYEKLYYQDSVVLVMKGFEYKLEKILTTLTTIDLSSNNFEGEIPDWIAKLKALKGLNFSRNRLIGLVPPLLGDLSNLEWLDLSSNELAGRIPWRLTNLNQLYFLNLSHNRLEGPIPAGKQFDTFVNKSYTGNPGLCGFPLSKSCNEDPKEDDRKPDGEDGMTLEWKAAVMGFASGVVIGASIGYMLLYTGSFHYWVMKRFGREQRHLTISPLGRRRRN